MKHSYAASNVEEWLAGITGTQWQFQHSSVYKLVYIISEWSTNTITEDHIC